MEATASAGLAAAAMVAGALRPCRQGRGSEDNRAWSGPHDWTAAVKRVTMLCTLGTSWGVWTLAVSRSERGSSKQSNSLCAGLVVV
jgi:hypothetical protein